MSIRQGVYRVGETIEISAIFTDDQGLPATNISGGRLIIKYPPPSNATTTTTIIPVDGIVELDIKPLEIGTYKVRVECDLPSPTVREAKFEVVDSMVVPVLPYSFY